MGIRQLINQSKGAGTAVIAALFVVVLCVFMWSRDSGIPGRQRSVFYSSDDGATYFSESISKIPPFDRGGKTAVRAHVYQRAGKPPEVLYLERYTESAKPKLAELMGKSDLKSQAELGELLQSGVAEVKRPGDKDWTRTTSAGATAIVSTPEGMTAVYP